MKVCPHCTARWHLEGEPRLDGPAPEAAAVSTTTSAAASGCDSAMVAARPPKRQRTAAEAVEQLSELAVLLGEGLLSRDAFVRLKQRLWLGSESSHKMRVETTWSVKP